MRQMAPPNTEAGETGCSEWVQAAVAPSPDCMVPSPPGLLTVYLQGLRTVKPTPTEGLSLNAPALRHAVLSCQTLVIEPSRQGKRKEESLPWRVISSQYAEPKNGMLTCREVRLADTPVTIRAGWGGDRGPKWTLTKVARVPTEEAVYPISVKCLFATKRIWIGSPGPRSSSHQQAAPSKTTYTQA